MASILREILLFLKEVLLMCLTVVTFALKCTVIFSFIVLGGFIFSFISLLF